jgi:uncharacterized protein YqjF (DUF2071 family)
VDRLTASRREACRTRKTGEQSWQKLLFAHWEVDVGALQALLPKALEVDLFDGRAFVGLVPFTMHAVRLGPVRVRDFLEANLRTYVHVEGVPGVWFFSLDANSRMAVLGGRSLFRLPYFHAQMSSATSGSTTAYRSTRRGSIGAAIDARWAVLDSEPHVAVPGTLEHFLTERYCLYGPSGIGGVPEGRDAGPLCRVRIHHPPWPLHRARIESLESSLPEAAGVMTAGPPIGLALASPAGVAVETFAAERVG